MFQSSDPVAARTRQTVGALILVAAFTATVVYLAQRPSGANYRGDGSQGEGRARAVAGRETSTSGPPPTAQQERAAPGDSRVDSPALEALDRLRDPRSHELTPGEFVGAIRTLAFSPQHNHVVLRAAAAALTSRASSQEVVEWSARLASDILLRTQCEVPSALGAIDSTLSEYHALVWVSVAAIGSTSPTLHEIEQVWIGLVASANSEIRSLTATTAGHFSHSTTIRGRALELLRDGSPFVVRNALASICSWRDAGEQTRAEFLKLLNEVEIRHRVVGAEGLLRVHGDLRVIDQVFAPTLASSSPENRAVHADIIRALGSSDVIDFEIAMPLLKLALEGTLPVVMAACKVIEERNWQVGGLERKFIGLLESLRTDPPPVDWREISRARCAILRALSRSSRSVKGLDRAIRGCFDTLDVNVLLAASATANAIGLRDRPSPAQLRQAFEVSNSVEQTRLAEAFPAMLKDAAASR